MFLHLSMEYIQLKITSENTQGNKDKSVGRRVFQTMSARGETEDWNMVYFCHLRFSWQQIRRLMACGTWNRVVW